ncbi:MAG: hypothetical protein ACFCU6_09815 [Balneolaceae bacterium]
MNMIKNSITVTVIFLIAASSSVLAQQSDYQIQQDFRNQYNTLVERVDNAVSSDDLIGLLNEIESLEAEFSGSESLINAAIYPETFQGRISDLRSRFANTDQNVAVIEQLNERVEELSEELQTFRIRLNQFEQRSDSLEQLLGTSRSSERRVSALARQYRENLEERDEFVVNFMRDLLNRYEDMDPATVSELAAREDLDDNPLDIIKTIVAEYINRADQETGLEPVDYLQMRAQQVYFNDVWVSIGERLSRVFAPDRPVQARQEVTDMLSAWLASVDNKLWGSLTTAFSQNGINLPSFSSSDTFHNAILGYVDTAVEASRQQNTEEDYDAFRSFNNFWNNRVKADWGELIVEAKVLDFSQITAIDLRINDWNEAAIPTSNLMMILFIVSIVVIIGLIVMLVTKKG